MAPRKKLRPVPFHILARLLGALLGALLGWLSVPRSQTLVLIGMILTLVVLGSLVELLYLAWVNRGHDHADSQRPSGVREQ